MLPTAAHAGSCGQRGLVSALDKKTYKVEIDDWENVFVKKHKGPDFAIELVESTVKARAPTSTAN